MKIGSLIFTPVIMAFIASGLTGCGSDDQPFRVVLGTSNILYKTSGDLQYQLPFVVQVTKIEGTPASFVSVSFTVTPTEYRKGLYVKTDISSPPDGTLDEWQPQFNATCAIEDSNRNGNLDTGEDINGNGILDPTNPATISAHSTLTPTIDNNTGRLTTDENGFGYFVMSYPPSEAYWVHIELTAIAAGNSEPEIYRSELPALDSDLSNIDIMPPGDIYGKYGNASVCTDPN